MKKGWETKAIGDICTLQRGFDLPQQKRTAGRYPLVSSSGVIDTHCEFKVDGPGVVTGRSGTIGGVFLVSEKFWPLNTCLYVKDFHGNDAAFVFYLLQYLNLGRFASGAGVPTLNRNSVHAERASVPLCVEEQRRIVAILDEAFEGIAAAKANAEKNLRNAKEVFRALADERLRQAAATFPNVSLSSVCNFVRGPFGGSLKKSMFVADGYAVYEQQHAINDQFSDIRYFIKAGKFQAMNRFSIMPGDLIMSCSGTMGRVAIAPPDVRPGIINQALLKLTPSTNVDSKFLRCWMESGAFQVALKESSGGAAMQNVASVKILKQIEMPLPPIKEQQRIVFELETAQSLTARLEETQACRSSGLSHLQASLLHQAFTGQL